MPDLTTDASGELVECDACVQNYLLVRTYACSKHETREPTEHAKQCYRDFYSVSEEKL
jgi:hypothetical protein